MWIFAESSGQLERFCGERHGKYNGCFVDGHVAAILEEDLADPDGDLWRGF